MAMTLSIVKQKQGFYDGYNNTCLCLGCVASQDMRAPDRCRNQKRADRLMRNGKDDVDPCHHGGNAQQDLDAERAMDSSRCSTNACFFDPSCHQDQRNHRDPRPPAMDEMGEIGIIHQSIKCTLGGINAIGMDVLDCLNN